MNRTHITDIDPTIIKRAAYQRPVDTRRAAKMAATWSDDLAGVITVSLRDRNFWVVIGSHRTAAAVLAKKKTIPAQVIEGMTYEEEAKLFLTNARTTVNIKIFDRYQSGLEAGDPTDLELQRVMAKFGVTLRPSGHTEGYNASGIGAARLLAEKGELERVMRIIYDAWHRPTTGFLRDALSTAALAGLGAFLSKYPHVKGSDVSRAMENYHPVDLFKTGGGSNVRAVVDVLTTWYNNGRRGRNRLAR